MEVFLHQQFLEKYYRQIGSLVTFILKLLKNLKPPEGQFAASSIRILPLYFFFLFFFCPKHGQNIVM